MSEETEKDPKLEELQGQLCDLYESILRVQIAQVIANEQLTIAQKVDVIFSSFRELLDERAEGNSNE